MDFPAILPAPLRDGYGFGPLPRVRRTRFDQGNLRARRHSADAPWRIDVSWRLTAAELAIFDDWFANDIAYGADEFFIDLANGLGMGTVTARFAASPETSRHSAAVWDVRAALRVTSLPVLDTASLAVASEFYPDDIVAAASPLHTLIHTTLPDPYWVTP